MTKLNKGPEMERLSWIIQVDHKCNHRCPYKREAEENYKRDRRGEGKMTTEAETVVMWSQSKECWQPPEARRGK